MMTLRLTWRRETNVKGPRTRKTKKRTTDSYGNEVTVCTFFCIPALGPRQPLSGSRPCRAELASGRLAVVRMQELRRRGGLAPTPQNRVDSSDDDLTDDPSPVLTLATWGDLRLRTHHASSGDPALPWSQVVPIPFQPQRREFEPRRPAFSRQPQSTTSSSPRSDSHNFPGPSPSTKRWPRGIVYSPCGNDTHVVDRWFVVGSSMPVASATAADFSLP